MIIPHANRAVPQCFGESCGLFKRRRSKRDSGLGEVRRLARSTIIAPI